jgi:hypothetical protein
MSFEYFPTEIVTHIFLSCSVSGAFALSGTCRRFRDIFNSTKKLEILENAAEAQYGPLEDAVQLVTQNSSQPAHLVRSVPFSLALLKQVVHVGRTATKWCDVYPFKKWKDNYQDRRILDEDEQYRLRRALYRLWLYTRSFHNKGHPREYRMNLQSIRMRAELLHNWSTAELAEMMDVHAILREVIYNKVCPSNGSIQRKFKKRFPDHEHQLLFNIHLNYPPPPFAAAMPTSEFHNAPAANDPLFTHFHSSPALATKFHYAKYNSTPFHEPGAEGWGDDIGHYYVVEDMLKLDPEQILWLRDHAPLKGMVESFTKGLGEWFENNGETWGQTMAWVLNERGEDVGEVCEAVAEGEMGIALVED